MALLQISEPGLSAAPHQRRLAAGIDLGTTNSLVATVRSGQAETLADHEGRHLLRLLFTINSKGIRWVMTRVLTQRSTPPTPLVLLNA